ncbi:MAG: hypothetical protein NVSMB2_15710 [Chloroflexota bacterium]
MTEVAGTLERAGLNHHQRGRVRLVDDEGLEAVACEDYGRMRDSYAMLLSG